MDRLSDLMLDDTTKDLLIENGDLQLTEGLDRVKQHLSQRLKLFFGEWFLETERGIPYFQDIFKKNPDGDIVDATFKKAVIETPGVVNLQEFSIDYDNATRSITVKLRALTTDGVIDYTEEIAA